MPLLKRIISEIDPLWLQNHQKFYSKDSIILLRFTRFEYIALSVVLFKLDMEIINVKFILKETFLWLH